MPSLHHRIPLDLLEYWQSLCPRGDLPSRAQIDPALLGDTLPYAFVVQRTGSGTARFRVAGGQLGALAGFALKGLPLSTLFDPREGGRLTHFLEQLFVRPMALELELVTRRVRTGRVMPAEMMLLPLRDDEGAVTRALGCLVASGPVAPDPCDFRIAATRETALSLTAVPDRPRPLPLTLSGPTRRRAAPVPTRVHGPRLVAMTDPSALPKRNDAREKPARAAFLRVVK